MKSHIIYKIIDGIKNNAILHEDGIVLFNEPAISL